MTQRPIATRRTFLAAAGAGGAAALAGCAGLGGLRQEEPAANDDTDEDGLDAARDVDVDGIAGDPTDLPPPVDWTEPRRHEVTLTTSERVAEIEPGVTFAYMTFDDRIPGPMIRVREGDTVHLTLENPSEMSMVHNIDSHAIYGPGGGAADTNVAPGETAEIEFQATYPGVHIYHCAVPNLDYHISSGMFGALLVEPKDGLPEVDRELYFGQHELYTEGEPGQEGHHAFDFEAMEAEDPTYVVVNAEAYGFTPDGQYGPVTAERGDRIRVWFANGGPNLTCAWHPIGNVWADLYRSGDLLSPPARNVETTPVPPGNVTMGEMDTPVPGPIKLVDHALSRVVHRGRLAIIEVEGEPNPDVYDPDP